MKIDFHVHTNLSLDSINTPAGIVKNAMKKGLDGVAITDHNAIEAAAKVLSEAKGKGASKDFLVIAGEEINTDRGEVLGIFLSEKIPPGDFLEVTDKIRAQGGLAILPHPFDSIRKRFHFELGEWESRIDAIETFNSRITFRKHNEQAEELAEKTKKPKTGGSDAHFPFEIGNAYAEIDAHTEQGIITGIRKGKTRVSGKKTTFLVHGPTKLVRFARKIGAWKA